MHNTTRLRLEMVHATCVTTSKIKSNDSTSCLPHSKAAQTEKPPIV